jgi:hypothetical protein
MSRPRARGHKDSALQGESNPMSQQTVRHKIFVSYHHGGDQSYYDAFLKAFHDTY